MPGHGTMQMIENVDRVYPAESKNYLGVRIEIDDDVGAKSLTSLGEGRVRAEDEIVFLFTPGELRSALARGLKESNKQESGSMRGGLIDLFD